MIKLFDWDVAKLVRHLTLNQAIAGSNPTIPIWVHVFLSFQKGVATIVTTPFFILLLS